eukprot:scaffold131932_cov19-Tisochrysis_lutea.AAC.2
MGDEEGDGQSRGGAFAEQDLQTEDTMEQATQTRGQEQQGVDAWPGSLGGSGLGDLSEEESSGESSGDDRSSESEEEEQGVDWDELMSVCSDEGELEEEEEASDSEPKAGTGRWYASHLHTPLLPVGSIFQGSIALMRAALCYDPQWQL